MKACTCIGAVAPVLSTGVLPAAADDLPILSGRWSPGSCGDAATAGSRWFSPGATARANDRCRVAVTRKAGKVFDVHLDCRYREAANDRDDAVIEVESPFSLRWIDQCTATRYRFCARDGMPSPFTTSGR